MGLQRVSIAASGAGTVELGAATTGVSWELVDYLFSLTGDGTVQFKSNSTALSGPMDLAGKAPVGFRGDGSTFAPIKSVSGQALNLVAVGAGVNGWAVVRN